MKMLLALLVAAVTASVSLAQCPSCPGPVCPATDPFNVTYASLVGHVQTGARGILVVGLPDRWSGTAQLHATVPAGFAGLATGEYECYKGPDGRAWMRLNVPQQIPLASACDCCKPTCTCKPGAYNPDCRCYPCECKTK